MTVLFLTQFGLKGGSSRIQVLQFFPLFAATGMVAVHRRFYPDAFYDLHMGLRPATAVEKTVNLLFYLALSLVKKCWYALTAFRYEVVVIQKEVFPRSIFSLLRRVNPHVIYELDDTIFEINPFLKSGRINAALLAYQARLCRYMMRHAAVVVAENDYLAQEAHRHNETVFVLPAPIDTNRFYPLAAPQRRREVLLGWIGSPSTTYLLEKCYPVLRELAVRRSGWKLKTVGARNDLEMPGVPLEKKPWSLDDELADLHSFDIGIMPLDDTPFNRGRLGYKIIQYMAVGIPTVADDIGLNRMVIRDGHNGFLVGSHSAWVAALSRLIEDTKLRHRLGEQARRYCVEAFALPKQFEVWQRALVAALATS